MFIQVMKGKCSRQDELRGWSESWRDEVGAEAPGFLGGTFGFTDDGVFVGVVRFGSREEAMANSARPEQDRWAKTFGSYFDGPVEFTDYDDVQILLDGGSDDAGFVQVIEGRIEDRSLLDVLNSDPGALRAMRPDIVGATFGIAADGSYTETVAFRDEESARTGEQSAPPAEVAAALEKLLDGATFLDLHKPWFESP